MVKGTVCPQTSNQLKCSTFLAPWPSSKTNFVNLKPKPSPSKMNQKISSQIRPDSTHLSFSSFVNRPVWTPPQQPQPQPRRFSHQNHHLNRQSTHWALYLNKKQTELYRLHASSKLKKQPLIAQILLANVVASSNASLLPETLRPFFQLHVNCIIVYVHFITLHTFFDFLFVFRPSVWRTRQINNQYDSMYSVLDFDLAS